HAQRNAFIHAFVDHYNRTRLRCLGHKAPAEILHNLPGHNTKAGTHGSAAPAAKKMDSACAATRHSQPKKPLQARNTVAEI
ncbi:MAG: transposase, partial [Alphaproteobacteria bacterium]